MATETERERLIYPDVVAKTEMGDDNRYIVTATTNNNDTVVKTYIYWHVPEEGKPVLMIEIDDETPDGEVTDDVRVRIRRNDGLIFEGVPSEQEYKDG